MKRMLNFHFILLASLLSLTYCLDCDSNGQRCNVGPNDNVVFSGGFQDRYNVYKREIGIEDNSEKRAVINGGSWTNSLKMNDTMDVTKKSDSEEHLKKRAVINGGSWDRSNVYKRSADSEKRAVINGGFWDRSNVYKRSADSEKRAVINGGSWDRSNVYKRSADSEKRAVINGGFWDRSNVYKRSADLEKRAVINGGSWDRSNVYKRSADFEKRAVINGGIWINTIKNDNNIPSLNKPELNASAYQPLFDHQGKPTQALNNPSRDNIVNDPSRKGTKDCDENGQRCNIYV